ncbi:MAG: hypothetical protein R2826_11265 [Thermoleophilia bacterium]
MNEGRIRGKVARLLNARELALNIGSDQGVVPGMRFAVLNPRGEDITDPDTGETLGSVEVQKVLVEATRVEPRVCVARTYRTRTTRVSGGVMPKVDFFSPPKYRTTAETLRAADNPGQAEIDESDSFVKVGDPVVEIEGQAG